MNEISKQTIKIYPNPATDFINIQNIGDIEMEVQLTDISGKILSSFYLKSHELKKFSTAQFEKGMYVLRYQVGAIVVSRKLIKI